MGCERINLGYTCHGGNKGRTYRSSGTNQISVFNRFPNKLLSDDIHNGITVTYDRLKLSFKSLGYYGRKFFSIHGMSLIIADTSKRLIRILNDGRTFIGSDRCDGITHIRDLVCIQYYSLHRFVRTEI